MGCVQCAVCAVTVCVGCCVGVPCLALPFLCKNSCKRKDREPQRGQFQAANLDLSPGHFPLPACLRAGLPACLQVIAVICVLVWIMNINRFNDPALGGWVSGEEEEERGGAGGAGRQGAAGQGGCKRRRAGGKKDALCQLIKGARV